MIPTIATERLILRGWGEGDFEGFARFRMSEESCRFIGGPLSRDDAWRAMAAILGHWTLRGYGHWVVERKEAPGYIGHIGLWNPLGFPAPEVGWNLLPEYHGKGYAVEAARAARAYAYGSLNWPTAISTIHPDHHASQKVAAKLGAVLESYTTFRGFPVGIYRHPAPSSLI